MSFNYLCNPDTLNNGRRLLLTEFKKRLLLRCIYHFELDLINNMDHMRISDTEPSSVILGRTMYFEKLKSDAPKVQKQAEAKWDRVIIPQNYNFNQF